MVVERLDGVESAAFSYEASTGEVVFDGSRTTPATIIRELERMTGYIARVRSETREPAMPAQADSLPRR